MANPKAWIDACLFQQKMHAVRTDMLKKSGPFLRNIFVVTSQRGLMRKHPKVKRVMKSLGLTSPHISIIVEDTPQMRGSLNIIEPLVDIQPTRVLCHTPPPLTPPPARQFYPYMSPVREYIREVTHQTFLEHKSYLRRREIRRASPFSEKKKLTVKDRELFAVTGKNRPKHAKGYKWAPKPDYEPWEPENEEEQRLLALLTTPRNRNKQTRKGKR